MLVVHEKLTRLARKPLTEVNRLGPSGRDRDERRVVDAEAGRRSTLLVVGVAWSEKLFSGFLGAEDLRGRGEPPHSVLQVCQNLNLRGGSRSLGALLPTRQ